MTRCSSAWFCHRHTANAATTTASDTISLRAQLIEMLDDPEPLGVPKLLDRDRHDRGPWSEFRGPAQRAAAESSWATAWTAGTATGTRAGSAHELVNRSAVMGRLAVQAVLEATHAVTERAANLREALRAEHQQHDEEQNQNVERVVESHARSLPFTWPRNDPLAAHALSGWMWSIGRRELRPLSTISTRMGPNRFTGRRSPRPGADPAQPSVAAPNSAARAAISLGAMSSTCVATLQRWPKGSSNWPERSP